jgi:hypothetical protein
VTAGRGTHQLLQAAAIAALAVTLVAGSMFLWIGIPLAGLWLAGELTRSAQHFLLLALCGIPTSMVAFGWLLYRINSVYEGLRAAGRPAAPQRSAWLRSSTDAHRRADGARAPRALIDIAMSASAWTAAVLMAVWFFFYAELWLVSW